MKKGVNGNKIAQPHGVMSTVFSINLPDIPIIFVTGGMMI